jgi:hypothetical protein
MSNYSWSEEMTYTYPRSDPKNIQADSVEWADVGYTVNVTLDGETWKNRQVEWIDPFADKPKSDVLVEHPKKGWLRIWFYDRDIASRPT